MRPLVDNEISKKTGFGNFDPALVTETWKWVAASQDYPESKLNPESVIDKSLLT
jgi:NitT/TauT family transport system substrate-binding protein